MASITDILSFEMDKILFISLAAFLILVVISDFQVDFEQEDIRVNIKPISKKIKLKVKPWRHYISK